MRSLIKQKIFNMVKFRKYIFISLTVIFIFSVNFCQAADIIYKPEVTFPGFETATTVTPLLLGNYISALYQYLLYVAGVLAVIVVMVGGFQWITAGGNQSKIGEAKERVMSAIIGLFLALSSYLLLFTINPELVKIHDLYMPSIVPISEDTEECATFLSANKCPEQCRWISNQGGGGYQAVGGTCVLRD